MHRYGPCTEPYLLLVMYQKTNKQIKIKIEEWFSLFLGNYQLLMVLHILDGSGDQQFHQSWRAGSAASLVMSTHKVSITHHSSPSSHSDFLSSSSIMFLKTWWCLNWRRHANKRWTNTRSLILLLLLSYTWHPYRSLHLPLLLLASSVDFSPPRSTPPLFPLKRRTGKSPRNSNWTWCKILQ